MTTLNNELIETLSTAGLNKNEAQIYLAVLELDSSSIWDISKKSGIKRPTCYVILDELAFRGIANKYFDGKRIVYSVITPKQMSHRLEQKYNKFKASASQLEALASVSLQKPKITLYEGVEGIKQAYRLSLDQSKGSEILIYGTIKIENIMTDFINTYLKERIEKKIYVKAILKDNPENKSVVARDKKELRQTRFLPEKEFDPNLEVNIFADFIVYIAHSEKEPFATIIENKNIANHERQKFNLIWKIAKS